MHILDLKTFYLEENKQIVFIEIHFFYLPQTLSRVLNLGLPWAYPNFYTKGQEFELYLTDSKTKQYISPTHPY